jgi:hypothetical protein
LNLEPSPSEAAAFAAYNPKVVDSNPTPAGHRQRVVAASNIQTYPIESDSGRPDGVHGCCPTASTSSRVELTAGRAVRVDVCHRERLRPEFRRSGPTANETSQPRCQICACTPAPCGNIGQPELVGPYIRCFGSGRGQADLVADFDRPGPYSAYRRSCLIPRDTKAEDHDAQFIGGLSIRCNNDTVVYKFDRAREVVLPSLRNCCQR